MNKKNGFTLVEILTVIVIMGLILILVLPTFKGMSKRVKQEKYDKTIYAIEEAANIYANKGTVNLKDNGDYIEITLQTLIDDKLLTESELINPLTNNPFNYTSPITIIKKGINNYDVEMDIN
jgi:prepilin-type N-terminal cleavage/methylation domain-containing protein